MHHKKLSATVLLLAAVANPAFAADGWLGLRNNVEATGSFFDRRIEKVSVESTVAGGPAEAAGVKAGDVIVSVDGKELRGAKAGDLSKYLYTQAGQKVVLTVVRGTDKDAKQLVLTAVERK